MKKALACFLCLVMCLSSVSVLAYIDYSDVSEEYVQVTDLLYELGIMEGFDDGTFRPDDTLTRAEAAAIMVRLIGLEDDAEQGETAFCDVPESHWASGYVNVAEANGIINGMGDGTFDPDGLVTYMQFAKMLVCLLGYEPAVQANGGWTQGGYLYVASKIGFTKGVNGKADDVITRMTAARLVYNCLEADIVEYETAVNTGIISSGPYAPLPSKCILTEYLGCGKIDGVITGCADGKVEVVITKNYYDDNINYKAGQKIVFTDKTRNAKELIGYTIIAYVKKTNEGDLFLVADEKAGKNFSVTLKAEDILTLTSDVLWYAENGKGKKCEIENIVEIKKQDPVVVDCNFIVNGELKPDFDMYKEYKNLEEITFLDNDNDGIYEFIIVNTEK